MYVLNLGVIIEEEILLRDKKHKTLLPFSVLIANSCNKDIMTFLAKTNVEVIPTSSTDIRSTDTDYYRDNVEPRRTSPVKRYEAIDIDTLEKDTTPST